MPGPNHQVRMSSRPESHRSNGGIDWVASSRISCGERVQVVSLERRDVAVEQRGVDLARVRLGGVGLAQRRAGALQRAVDRRDGGLEQLGDLGRAPVEHLAEDQHGALLRRQVLQRGDEREPDRVALDRDLGRVGDRLDPGHLGKRVQVLEDRGARRAEIHRPGTAPSRAEHVEADVRRDPVEPGAERRATLEPVEALPGADERVLHGVLGVERRAEHPVAVAGQLRPVLLQLTEGGRCSRRCSHHGRS